MTSKLYLGDCLDILATLDENSIDTCITDPPYGLGFMGKEWDTFDKSQFGLAGNEGENDLKVKKNFKVLPRYNNGAGLYDFTLQWATEVYRVLKPGGLLLAFGGTRTYHRLVCGIEDAGFEIRDTIGWVYGSGFPKSLDISKAIDKSKGAEKEALLWNGWGTALKPAMELIVVAMKPNDGSYAENALKWGVSGLNIDECRIGVEKLGGETVPDVGRFPANVILDEEASKLLDEQSGKKKGGKTYDYTGKKQYQVKGFVPNNKPNSPSNRGDSGGASRFFYCAKASRSERNAGLEGMELKIGGGMKGTADQTLLTGSGNIRNNKMQNHHPTVKPIALMRYLVRLTKTPTGGTVLDPFMGSGTTGIACALEGREFIGIEKEREYYEIAEKRINYWSAQPSLL